MPLETVEAVGVAFLVGASLAYLVWGALQIHFRDRRERQAVEDKHRRSRYANLTSH